MYKIRRLFLFLKEHVQPLGDPAYQKEFWVNKPEIDDYDDAMHYFLSELDEIFEHPERFEGVNKTILNALKALSDKIDWFSEEVGCHIPEPEIERLINTPEWKEVQLLARETLETIYSNLKDRGYEPS